MRYDSRSNSEISLESQHFAAARPCVSHIRKLFACVSISLSSQHFAVARQCVSHIRKRFACVSISLLPEKCVSHIRKRSLVSAFRCCQAVRFAHTEVFRLSQHFAVAGRAFRTHETSNGYDYDSDYHYDDEYDYDYDDDDYDYDYEPGLSPGRVRPGVSTATLPVTRRRPLPDAT